MPEVTTLTTTRAAKPSLKLARELVSFLAPASLEAEQYRTLRHAVERLRRESGYQVLAVTSAGAGDGKTLTTLNLAGALAQSPSARVLVVSADLREERVTEYLGLPRGESPGLTGAIESADTRLIDAVTRLEPLNLSILTAGDVRAQPYELLASFRFEALMSEARQLFDYILVDTPPVVPLADSRLLGRWVDGFLLVVTAHLTPRRMVVEALNLLDPNKTIGLVFNGDDQPLTPYYGYYYGERQKRPRRRLAA